jgi:hypothetical protein
MQKASITIKHIVTRVSRPPIAPGWLQGQHERMVLLLLLLWCWA